MRPDGAWPGLRVGARAALGRGAGLETDSAGLGGRLSRFAVPAAILIRPNASASRTGPYLPRPVLPFPSALLEYLDRKTKELQAANKFAEWAMCCVKCFMWCLEQVVKFINRNAYIMVALKGKGYCQSAMAAVKLIVSVSAAAVPGTVHPCAACGTT